MRPYAAYFPPIIGRAARWTDPAHPHRLPAGPPDPQPTFPYGHHPIIRSTPCSGMPASYDRATPYAVFRPHRLTAALHGRSPAAFSTASPAASSGRSPLMPDPDPTLPASTYRPGHQKPCPATPQKKRHPTVNRTDRKRNRRTSPAADIRELSATVAGPRLSEDNADRPPCGRTTPPPRPLRSDVAQATRHCGIGFFRESAYIYASGSTPATRDAP